MKKESLTILLALAFTVGAALPAGADEMEEMMMKSYCPMMTMKHSKELGLSKKQEAKIQEIKDRMWGQMKPIAEKASADVEAVLNTKQENKYRELMSSQRGHHGGGHKEDCDCDSCKKDECSEGAGRQKHDHY